MGWDLFPDSLEDGFEKGVRKLGDGVEWLGDRTAEGLDKVGWESGADWVRDKSRSTANAMGADTDELQLGQTEDPRKLVYGSAGKLRSTAGHLRDFAKSFDNVGKGIKGLDSSGIEGEAADAFRTKAAEEPPKWFKAADACEKAAGALEDFADTVEWAQGRAKEAITKYNAAVKASEDARTAHNKKVDAYNKAVDAYNAKVKAGDDPGTPPVCPAAFEDPGPAKAEEAEEILAEARKQRDTAAEKARSAVKAAREKAPPKPSYGEQFKYGMAGMHLENSHVLGGFLRSGTELVALARSLNPTDLYNIGHPGEYATTLNSTVAGLLQASNDPVGTGKQMVSAFMKDPAEGGGRLVFDAALTVLTGGAGASVKGARIAADASRARRALDNAPSGTNSRPDNRRTVTGTDPVDLASGRMFLPQVDVCLPGSLPLKFTRRAESGYTVGRFFGPSWSSTVDERLEIDAAGVIHVTADGLLLPYPHPVPGLPTLPETGTSRSTLVREGTGDYTLADHETGLTRTFTAPHDSGPGGDGDAWLTRICDRNGNTITIDRATDGTPRAIVHSCGYHLAVSTAEGRVTALAQVSEAPADIGEGEQPQALRTYGYHDGDLVTVSKSSGSVLTFEYDHRRRIVSWTDSNQRRYDYAYDDRDRCIAEGGEAGHVQVTFSYGDPEPVTGHRLTTLTTADGRVTRHLIDRHSQVLATTDPMGNTVRFTYDDRGNPLTRTDALGRTTAFAYDESGRLVTITRPDGNELRTTHGPLGLSTEFVGPDGARWQQEFDEHGNRTAVVDPAGHTTRYTYGSRGRLTSITDALGAVTKVRCDPAGLPLEVRDPLGGTTHIERDAAGRPVRVTDPLGSVTRLDWNTDGELERRTAPDGTSESWTYDGEGNCIAHTDTTGAVTRFEYTHFDLLVARTGPDGARYEFTHDADLRLTAVTGPQGLTWSYEYDPAGRLVSETDFDGRTLVYTRDAAGQLTTRTDPLGQTIDYTYDALGRLVRKDAAGALTTYVYDQTGRLLRATGPDSELIRQYDRRGRIKTELVDGRAITYAYDALGRRIRRTTPTGQTTTYEYDAAGRPTRVNSGGHHIDFTHDAAGRELERCFGDNLTITSAWDEAGRLASQHLATPDRTVNRRTYAYRADGYVTGIADQVSGDRVFDLDALGRVTGVRAEGWTEKYAYDADGNQTSASWPESHPVHEASGPRTYTGTAIARAGNVHYKHDALGRVTLRRKSALSRKARTWHYTWDVEDRLTSVRTPDGAVWCYRYDPLGRRTAKFHISSDGETVHEEVLFTWDGATLCEQTTLTPELPHPIALTWEHSGLHPLAQTERILAADSSQEVVDQRFFAIATDLVGTPTELVDETGALAWHARSTLWGATAWARSSATYIPLRFPGQYYDPETGFHYNLFRHYDPETGRYTAPDPLGITPAPNPAAYVHNPYTLCDPFGLSPYPQFKGLGWITDKMLERPSFRYQRTVTNQDYEQQWILPDGREVHVDGGPANGWTTEAKWTGGDRPGEWEKSPYNPDHRLYRESKITDQTEKLLALNEGTGGKGVRYMVSNEWGAAHVNEVLARSFPEEFASGKLRAYHVPGNGMSGMSEWLQ